jgi:Cu/Ag efflux pump CusA
MLARIVRLSLRHQGIVLALSLVLLGWGGYVASRASLDVFPEFVQPQVTVQAEAPGLSPEQVETLVTRPIENAVNGATDLESVRSESIRAFCVVTAVLSSPAPNIHLARPGALRAASAPSRASSPEASTHPRCRRSSPRRWTFWKIGMMSEKLTPRELRTFADWTLKPRLLAVPGVAGTNVFGGEVEQLQVQVLPEKLAAFDLPSPTSSTRPSARPACAARALWTRRRSASSSRPKGRCSRRRNSAKSSCAKARRSSACAMSPV